LVAFIVHPSATQNLFFCLTCKCLPQNYLQIDAVNQSVLCVLRKFKNVWMSSSVTFYDTILAELGPYQVLRFRRAKYVLGRKEFRFIMFETNFSEHNKIWWVTKRFGATARECSRECGPGQNRRQKVHWGPSCLCSGTRRSENLYLIHNMNSTCRLCKLSIKYFPANTHNRLVVSSTENF